MKIGKLLGQRTVLSSQYKKKNKPKHHMKHIQQNNMVFFFFFSSYFKRLYKTHKTLDIKNPLTKKIAPGRVRNLYKALKKAFLSLPPCNVFMSTP